MESIELNSTVLKQIQPAPRVRSEPMGDRVAHHLRVLIVTGQIPEGTHLVEGALADQFEVSRGPIRDAIKQLETEGLVESRRRGVHVVGFTDHDVEEVYSLREALEALAIRLTISTSQSVDWSVFDTAMREMDTAAESRSQEAFAAADLTFHSAFYEVVDHLRLRSVWRQFEPTFFVLLSASVAVDDLGRSRGAHGEILSAVHEGDERTAVELMSRHLERSKERVMNTRSHRGLSS